MWCPLVNLCFHNKTIWLQQFSFLCISNVVCLQSDVFGRINPLPVQLEWYLACPAQKPPLVRGAGRAADPPTETKPLLVSPAHFARLPLSHLPGGGGISTLVLRAGGPLEIVIVIIILVQVPAAPRTQSQCRQGTIWAVLSSLPRSPAPPHCSPDTGQCELSLLWQRFIFRKPGGKSSIK